MKLYIAGASSEVDMIAEYIDRAEKAGIYITYNWTKDVIKNRRLGIQDSDMTIDDRHRYAKKDYDGIINADAVWVLFPTPQNTSTGCIAELGIAIGLQKRIFVSGKSNCIFQFLVHRTGRFESHENAFLYITT